MTSRRTPDTFFRNEDVGADMEGYDAVCQDCDWRQPMPQRDMAEHAKRVHEDRYGHDVILERPE